jgi:hypothetical protein
MHDVQAAHSLVDERLGLASNATDAERFLGFVEATYPDREASSESPLPPRLRC